MNKQRSTNLLTICLLALFAITVGVNLHLVSTTPEEINRFHGYRTEFSISSQANWILVNDYFGKCLVWCSVVGFLVALVVDRYLLLWRKVIMLIAIWLLSFVLPIVLTEMYVAGLS